MRQKNCHKKVYFHRGVIIERVHYYVILAEGERTIREGVLIEEDALTEGVLRYVSNNANQMFKFITTFVRALVP